VGYWTLRAVYDLFPVLEERSNRPGTMLSGGQQQMLAIGRALMANPNLILLDEPSEGLSPVLIDGLVGALNAIRKAGTGVLVVEQHLNLVKLAYAKKSLSRKRNRRLPTCLNSNRSCSGRSAWQSTQQ
jgi:branched-chain amino acid transport system ATP-binding protein